MAVKETRTDIAIALLEQAQNNYQTETNKSFISLEKKVEENHADIIKRMDKFAFVSQKDHDRDMSDQRLKNDDFERRLLATEKYQEENAPVISTASKVFGKVSGYLITALAIGVIALIAFNLPSVVPAIFGGR